MRALVYLGPRRMEVQEVADPPPGSDQAHVRVRAAAICGSDLHGFREASPRRIPPLVMGHEVVGVVDAVGVDVDAALVGTRVVAMPLVSCGACARCREGWPNLCPGRRLMGMDFPGAFAEAFTIEARQLLPVPEGLSDAVGSMTEPLANAVHVVERSVRARDDVLVVGAGAIGLFAARLAVLSGAARTFVVDRLEDRLAHAAELEAEPLQADLAAEAIDRATMGAGVDTVIDAAGFPATWELSVQAARHGGRIEAIGLGAVEGPLSYQAVVAKGLTIVGSYACLERDFTRALELLSSGDVNVRDWVDPMSLADGSSAFERLVDGGGHTKIVLAP